MGKCRLLRLCNEISYPKNRNELKGKNTPVLIPELSTQCSFFRRLVESQLKKFAN